MKLDISVHTWLNAKPAQRVFAALGNDEVRFVGGCVRNAILGAPVTDFDMATRLEPQAVIEALKAANIAVHETGLAHGTITAVAGDTVFEITSLRRDVSTDGRRATVEFTTDWDEDAQRRDFTMNALYADHDGKVYDPTGQGLADIKGKHIRFVGTAKARIEEDYLRILRYFRFHAWYADDVVMDKDALGACRELRGGLKSLSSERVWAEFKKILGAPAPHRTVNVMQINGILETLLPDASNSEGLQLLIGIEEQAGLEIDPYLRLMAMAARDEFAIAGLVRRLKMSNAEKSRLLGWAGDRSTFTPSLSGRDLHIEIYKAGRQVAMDRAVLRAAGAEDPVIRNKWLSIFEQARDWEWPEFPLTGQDMIGAGVPSGPKVGTALEALKALWVRSGFSVDKQRLMAALALINR
ncbi:MAG: hypothetical protein COA69_00540 [Robiginitomaculum sp.]|nr:MAG: hypothetical protein COA69_00540 [Robiginitomaculum sp.]